MSRPPVANSALANSAPAASAIAVSLLLSVAGVACDEDPRDVRYVSLDTTGTDASDADSETTTVSPEVIPFDVGTDDAETDGGGSLFCGPANCDGCCNDQGECLSGDRPAACGSGGEACRPCFGGGRCTGETCVGRRICAAGTETACTENGGTWEEDQCCVRGVTTCVDGREEACPTSSSPAWRWTGQACCSPHPAKCVPGTEAACSDADRELVWTGDTCCAIGAESCTRSDSASSCGADGSDRAFTGEQCCTWES